MPPTPVRASSLTAKQSKSFWKFVCNLLPRSVAACTKRFYERSPQAIQEQRVEIGPGDDDVPPELEDEGADDNVHLSAKPTPAPALIRKPEGQSPAAPTSSGRKSKLMRTAVWPTTFWWLNFWYIAHAGTHRKV